MNHNRWKKVFLLLCISFGGSLYAAQYSLSCQTIPELFRNYLIRHVSANKLDDALKTRVVDQYIKAVDPSKVFFLKSDIERIKKNILTLFNTMAAGNCDVLTQIQAETVKKSEDMASIVKTFVSDKNYKLDESVELLFDSEKRDFLSKESERAELIKKMVHFRISNYLSSDMKLDEAKKQLIHSYELITKRLRERTQNEIYSAFIEAFSTSLDPHSGYFSDEDLEDFNINMRLSLEGIGASLSSQDGYTVVEEIIAGGAADRAKVLMPKDKIIEVSQETGKPVSVIDMDLREVVRMIRGKKGTKVILTLLRKVGQKTDRQKVTIVRDKIDLKDQAAKLVIENHKSSDGKIHKLGILSLPSFYGDTSTGGAGAKRSSYEDMKRLLKEANDKKVEGLVLDLSRNGGGLLDDAVTISGLFINLGGIVATKSTDEGVKVLEDKDPAVQYTGPLVVWISRRSASASEILAGALKDYQRAVIVGDSHTFGKGTVQAVLPLPRPLGAIKVTTGMFFRPGGLSTQHVGVKSDVEFPSLFNSDELGEKILPYSLPSQSIPPFVSSKANTNPADKSWLPLTNDVLAKLAVQSKKRVEKDTKFKEILKDLEEAQKNKGVIKLAEVRKKAAEEKKKDKAAEKKSLRQKIEEQEAPQRAEAVEILNDLVQLRKAS